MTTWSWRSGLVFNLEWWWWVEFGDILSTLCICFPAVSSYLSFVPQHPFASTSSISQLPRGVNMRQRTFVMISSVVLNLLAAVSPIAARILGCADVACPIAAGTTAKCTVVDRSFEAVGVVPIDQRGAVKGLSWVTGVRTNDASSNSSWSDQTFYLGTPDGFDFGTTGACSLFFTRFKSRVRRYGDSDDDASKADICQDTETQSCFSALVSRAKNADLNNLSGAAGCEKLQQDFSDKLDPACVDFSTTARWAGIQAKGESTAPALLG